MSGLSVQDQPSLWTLATLLMDAVPPWSKRVTEWLYTKLPELPDDDEFVKALEDHAAANGREVLVTLRSGISVDAHDAPAEAIEHARFLKSRGIGMRTMLNIYRPGYAMFRDVAILEFQEHAETQEEVDSMIEAVDAYAFPFITVATERLAAEFGSGTGWSPTKADPVLNDPEAMEQARRLREECLAAGTWLAATPEQTNARRDAEQILDRFAATVASAVRERGVSERLALAATTVAIELADEPDLGITLLLDRSGVEILDCALDAEVRLSIASVDLARIGSDDFFLPMAIAKGRVRCHGPARKFLRIVPIIRGLFDDGVSGVRSDHE